MKKIITVIAGILIAGTAHAQTAEGIKEGSSQVKLLLGGAQAAFNVGVEYERRTGTFGVGGFLMQSTKDEDAVKPESLTFALTATSHLVDRNKLEVEVQPGVAVTNVDSITQDGDDDTVVGPTLAIGAVYSLTPQWGVGMQYLSIYNWFSDKSVGKYDFANLVVGYNF
jgi:opacity protein-like surface antigen